MSDVSEKAVRAAEEAAADFSRCPEPDELRRAELNAAAPFIRAALSDFREGLEGLPVMEVGLCDCGKEMAENFSDLTEFEDGSIGCPDCEKPFETRQVIDRQAALDHCEANFPFEGPHRIQFRTVETSPWVDVEEAADE